MGSTNSCLPGALNSFHTLRHHSSTSKLKYDVEEVFNSHKNAININQVSEDELLLLPGITRQLAVNIVQYRHLNDGFKKVDEILRVNGITFNLFKHIYADITIDLSPSSDNKQEPVNLNLASYKELCSVPGLTPNLVERIIQRRERKGLFRFIEDLLKIKGIDYIILAAVRPHVTVNQHQLPTSISDTSINNFYPLSNRNHPRDALSLASILLETLPPELQTILVASPPHRPSTTNNNNNNNKQNIFRFASWNLQQLTNEKVRNPGVREVICRIILENKYEMNLLIKEILIYLQFFLNWYSRNWK
jgi:DNA uptake protein ComE-like DNA-binding protein